MTQYCYTNRNKVMSTQQQIHTNKYIELVLGKPTSIRAKVTDKYANTTNTTQTTLQSLTNSRESETPNVPLQEPSSD